MEEERNYALGNDNRDAELNYDEMKPMQIGDEPPQTAEQPIDMDL